MVLMISSVYFKRTILAVNISWGRIFNLMVCSFFYRFYFTTMFGIILTDGLIPLLLRTTVQRMRTLNNILGPCPLRGPLQVRDQSSSTFTLANYPRRMFSYRRISERSTVPSLLLSSTIPELTSGKSSLVLRHKQGEFNVCIVLLILLQ